jgi:hypothetical protein
MTVIENQGAPFGAIVTAPADTEPLPVMRNVQNLGSKKNWFTPAPVVAAT